MRKKPLVLCILDGWGIAPPSSHNAISQASLPNWERWQTLYPKTALDASGDSVGLPPGQMGNSEVGHMTMGAGRRILQDLPRIHKAFAEGHVETLPAFQKFLEALRLRGGRCHVMGLISPGGVHAHTDHLKALLPPLKDVPVLLHGMLDGRDTPPKSGAAYMADLDLPEHCTVATLMGRFYGMDRDHRFDRTQRAYEAMVFGKGEAMRPLESFYGEGVGDEFIPPLVSPSYGGVRPGDGLLTLNFRADRMIQILSAFLDPHFEGFPVPDTKPFTEVLGMVPYSKALTPLMGTLFPKEAVSQTLGDVLAEAGVSQLRAAETEKYAHVTYFFNGGKEDLHPGEERILVPSPQVKTYDLKPEMAAHTLTDHVLKALDHDCIIMNFANPDMVGHTGDFEATKKALETVDACLGRLEKAVLDAGGVMLVTADHGNAEDMGTAQSPQTAHTTNLVPFVGVGLPKETSFRSLGELQDIAPTLLTLMDLPIPKEMTGCSLFDH